MSLTTEQKNTVAQWVNEGASLSQIQKFIGEKFGISFTYMDVRFLVDDLDLTLKDKEVAPDIEETPAPNNGTDTTPSATDGTNLSPESDNVAPSPSGVSITVDPVQRPGVALGGSVTFSDGLTGQWQLDQYGQLGFVPPHPGYQPTPTDIQAFQSALQRELAKLGY